MAAYQSIRSGEVIDFSFLAYSLSTNVNMSLLLLLGFSDLDTVSFIIYLTTSAPGSQHPSSIRVYTVQYVFA
jgi:hypothetical protein